ncbi:MAG: RNA polymerase sigma factor [Planctomycetes bacterium]|nr:RNA polymerase sigma factor [Planctomycetota bacterium]
MDRETLGALVRAHQSELYRFLRYLGANQVVAEDLLQETFLAAFKSNNVPPEESTQQAAWLRGISRNIFLQHCRHEKRSRVHVNTDYVDQAESLWISEFLRDGDGFDYVEALRACLERLQPNQRKVVDQKYTHGLSRDEMARKNGMSADGIKSLLRRIRAALGDCISRRIGLEEIG